MILNSKKLRKLRTNPKLFFKDAIEKKVFWLSGVYNKYLPKKYKGFTQYTIISSVYNVEKYLDDYFNSIINQRIDFKKNIFMILVDDGSTDNSANIIRKYQKKYPKNIVYLYKENGGLSSARNLGLKYIQENNYKTPWVTFTDPDDFLDRNYFYEVDKFLSTHQDDDICMIGCNLIFYYEKQKQYKDEHPLNFKFKKKYLIKEVCNLNDFIQLGVQSAFFSVKKILTSGLYFDEKLRQFNEDLKFTNQFFIRHENEKVAYISSAKYFYRKRSSGNSIIDQASKNINLYLQASKLGTLDLLIDAKLNLNRVPLYVQYSVLYHFAWQVRSIVNNSEKLYFMNEQEKREYLDLLDKNFSYIDSATILNCSYKGFYNFEKKGILNCFKNEKLDVSEVYIEDYDPYKEQILITYYTRDDKNIESIRIDNEVIYADYEKIVKYDFLDRVFCYQKRLWVHVSKDAKDKLEVFINNKQIMIGKYGEYFLDIKNIRKEFQKRLPKSNIWLLMDRDYEADDNAEHLYRYIMQNHPEQEIVFALRKESSDWERLEKEGFNLIEFGSFEFERIIKKASKVISSHSDEYLMRYITPRQQFIFLQHGVTQNDVSKWLNSKKINLFFVATQMEFDSIIKNYTRYKFGQKEVILTGFARHDALLRNKQSDIKQIIIMPTWRASAINNVFNSNERNMKEKFKRSEYFQKWNSLLNNNNLKKLCEQYSYTVVFKPHPNIMPYLKDFNLPFYTKIANQDESLQMLFCNSSLMITDYSSVAFEMAYLKKPVIYYQFDKDVFFISHTLQKGYFDYQKDGFGPVVQDEDSLLIKLESLFRNNCKVFNNYKSNMESTFAFKDGKCCQRIYATLIQLNIKYLM
ncbi:CDP-glycerol:glycerophosphate glycerophosphotransferase [Campylobacter sp. CNRCH_2014_2452]|uniref:CDP-glycerol:glycerophosphate glycerophosphotransferase n=1 Tax=Campylobacter sp. CNRCH_2014_2452 TaxID=2911603 RepID=UPI0021E684CB|nr:CDP-glycerol:glycerophosphate glycerophosphotransferase [Campylobacter sp. CNRCH_2014_2452]MCV3485316.1 CDP-glycerol:glycerophosphate glycerophosphotransferase [Campylobacter sp. CNRCH_2014_2452]